MSGCNFEENNNMATFGAIPKTPNNSPRKFEKDTPRKETVNLRSFPKFCCILCAKEELSSKHRYKLFQDVTTKTVACTRLFSFLSLIY